jgi:cbb3-type cytochrome oxidase subunit 3
MSEQNFKNHSRYVPLYHFVSSGLIVLGLGGSIVNLIESHKHPETHYSAALLVLVFLILLLLFWYARAFALRAQDRAIRAEENFRHFILTGKPFDSRLRMGQIIGLRFASDEEMPALAKKAVEENLSSKQIKEAIKNWRADNNRA